MRKRASLLNYLPYDTIPYRPVLETIFDPGMPCVHYGSVAPPDTAEPVLMLGISYSHDKPAPQLCRSNMSGTSAQPQRRTATKPTICGMIFICTVPRIKLFNFPTLSPNSILPFSSPLCPLYWHNMGRCFVEGRQSMCPRCYWSYASRKRNHNTILSGPITKTSSNACQRGARDYYCTFFCGCASDPILRWECRVLQSRTIATR